VSLLLLLMRPRCQTPACTKQGLQAWGCSCTTQGLHVTGFGNLGTLVFAIAFTGGILAETTRDVWRVVGWLMLDGAAASATVAFVGFWVLATSAREVRHFARGLERHEAPARGTACLHHRCDVIP